MNPLLVLLLAAVIAGGAYLVFKARAADTKRVSAAASDAFGATAGRVSFTPSATGGLAGGSWFTGGEA